MAAPRKPAPIFLTLPAEIRLAIYECLLVNPGQQIVSIRSEDPEKYEQRRRNGIVSRRRTPYWIQPDLYRPKKTVETSYVLQTGGPTIHAEILGVNRQIHAEATRVLYGSHIFDFSTDVEGAVPFFQDLTPFALASIRRINLVKRPWPSSHHVERYKWSVVCAYVATHLSLQHLGLSVFGGKVDATRYIPHNTFRKQDFTTIAQFDGMEWVQNLLAIKGLHNLDITTIWEHCPAPCSNSLAFFVDFSASIENGFAEYLRENMVAGAA